MLFVGIDLAWSTRNGSGISIIKGDKNKAEVVDAKVVYSDIEILNFVKDNVSNKEALIAIDAPLIVPNAEGRRNCEALVGKFFRKYDAGAHPSNRNRLSSWTGTIRGEEVSKLSKMDWVIDPKKFFFWIEPGKKFFSE